MEKTKNHHPAGAGHEQTDADLRLLAGFSFSVMGLMLGAMLAMGGMFYLLRSRTTSHDAPVPPLTAALPEKPPEPRLQVNLKADLARVRAEENEALESYGWVDKNLGIVRIPIERAMELTIERGLPTRQKAQKK